MDFLQFKHGEHWRVPNWIGGKPRLFKEFIRSLADDEGTVFTKDHRATVAVSNNSLLGLQYVQKCLKKIGIKSKIRGPYKRNYILAITPGESLYRCYICVGFSHPKRKDLNYPSAVIKMVRG